MQPPVLLHVLPLQLAPPAAAVRVPLPRGAGARAAPAALPPALHLDRPTGLQISPWLFSSLLLPGVKRAAFGWDLGGTSCNSTHGPRHGGGERQGGQDKTREIQAGGDGSVALLCFACCLGLRLLAAHLYREWVWVRLREPYHSPMGPGVIGRRKETKGDGPPETIHAVHRCTDGQKGAPRGGQLRLIPGSASPGARFLCGARGFASCSTTVVATAPHVCGAATCARVAFRHVLYCTCVRACLFFFFTYV